MRVPNRNENAAAVEQLKSQVIEHAVGIASEVFSGGLPANWGTAWRDAFSQFQRQEHEARKLLADFSKNREGINGQLRAVRKFLTAASVDPEHFDFDRDFGWERDLSPSASWLLQMYESAGKEMGLDPRTPVEQLKSHHQRYGTLPQPTWTGFLLWHFEKLNNSSFRQRPSGWILDLSESMRAAFEAPEELFPSDAELAAISIIVFKDVFPGLGITLVSSDDPRNSESAPSLLDRHRTRIKRARLDREKSLREAQHRGEVECPGSEDRGVRRSGFTANLPWPRSFAGHSFEELAYPYSSRVRELVP